MDGVDGGLPEDAGLPARVLRNLDAAVAIDIALVILAAVAAIVLVERLVPILARHGDARLARFLAFVPPLVRLVVIALAFMLIIASLIKPTVQNLVALFGALGVAVGFALKDYLSGIAAGTVALFERPYRNGDWITVGSDYGKVRNLGFRAVQIVTADDTVVTIPHQKLWESNVKNANDGEQTLMCIADFYLRPAHDPAPACARLRDVALASPYLDLDRPVQVIVHEQAWGTHYRLKAYPMHADDQFHFTTDLTVRGKQELQALGLDPAAATTAIDASA
jgi:small-conductance mechanosensitive channel